MGRKADAYKAAEEIAASAKKRKAAPAAAAPHPATARMSHNDAHRVDHKATSAIEEHGAHTSRKSTRKSSNRAKPDSALRITARIRNASPEARATRKSGNPM